MKTRKKLIEQQEKLLKIYLEVEQELKKIPGVTGVGIGPKEVKGQATGDISFRVYVEEKKDEKDLSPEYIIPKEIKGVKTDILQIAEAKRYGVDTRKYRNPLIGGIAITNHKSDFAGTLGCFANLKDGSTVLISNYHVLYADGAKKGVEVGQPYTRCTWRCKCNVIGKIEDGVEGGLYDCAIARVTVKVSSSNTIKYLDEDANGDFVDGVVKRQATPIKEEPVRKVGIVTGHTKGNIKALGHVTWTSDDDGNRLDLHGQLLIESASTQRFAELGDSGAVVVNDANEVVGLYWGEDAHGHIANDIRDVTKKMKVTINSTTTPVTKIPISGSAPAISPLSVTAVSEEFSAEALLQEFENELNQSAKGQELLEVIKQNETEIFNLVNHNRRVMVTWRRKQGPAFVAAILNNLEKSNRQIPKEVNGVSLQTMLRNMAALLEDYGSRRLVEAIRKYSLEVFNYANECETLDNLFDNIKNQ